MSCSQDPRSIDDASATRETSILEQCDLMRKLIFFSKITSNDSGVFVDELSSCNAGNENKQQSKIYFHCEVVELNDARTKLVRVYITSGVKEMQLN